MVNDKDKCGSGSEPEGISIHAQHDNFLQKQIELASRHKECQAQLPRAMSSKRGVAGEELDSSKKVKRSSEEALVDEQGPSKGPRTVSSAEKNRRRKLKKKKRLLRKR